MSGTRREALAAFAFRPGTSPLHRAHPLVSVAPLAALSALTLAVESPLVIVSIGVAAWLLGAACGVKSAMIQALRFSLPLALLMIVVNGLVSHGGATVLFRGPDFPIVGGEITLEAFVAGSVIALRVVAIALLFAIWSACVDPDRVLTALRPVARHSALTAALVSRLVPVAAADFARLREGVELRGPAASPVGKPELARRVVSGSLDRSVEVAATLELRGHALPPVRRNSPRDTLRSVAGGGLWPLISALALIATAAVCIVEGGAGFASYPEISIDLSSWTVGLSFAILLLVGLSLLPWGLGARRWSR